MGTSSEDEKVVTFPDRKPPTNLIWTCNRCGCQSFTLFANGDTGCCRCEARSSEAHDAAETCWRKQLPPTPEDPASAPCITSENVTCVHHPLDFIKKSFAKAVTDGDPVVLVVVQRDGAMKMWAEGRGDTPEREQWFARKLKEIGNFFFDIVPDPPTPELPEMLVADIPPNTRPEPPAEPMTATPGEPDG